MKYWYERIGQNTFAFGLSFRQPIRFSSDSFNPFFGLYSYQMAEISFR